MEKSDPCISSIGLLFWDFLQHTFHKKAHSFDRFCKFGTWFSLNLGGYKVPASTVVALIWPFPKPLNFMTANNLSNRHWDKNLGRWTWTVSRVWATSRVHIHGNAGRVAWLMGSKGLEKNERLKQGDLSGQLKKTYTLHDNVDVICIFIYIYTWHVYGRGRDNVHVRSEIY